MEDEGKTNLAFSTLLQQDLLQGFPESSQWLPRVTLMFSALQTSTSKVKLGLKERSSVKHSMPPQL